MTNNFTLASDLQTKELREVVCDDKGCQIVSDWNVNSNTLNDNETLLVEPTLYIPKTKNHIIYFKKGTLENVVYRFVKKHKVISVCGAMNLISFIAVLVCGVILWHLADAIMQGVIFELVKEVNK